MDLNAIFTRVRDKLDAHYDRRERLIKISRDITALSKKMIFSLQRIQGEVTTLPADIQKEINQREGEIQRLLKKAEPDVQGTNTFRYHRQISPGLQEYIEALSFRHYILNKSIITPSQIQESYFQTLPLSYEDYILGVADLTGELMRRAISNVSTRHGQSLAIEICSTLRQLQSSYQRIYVSSSTSRGFTEDLIAKIEVMKASVAKVENACYNVKVRGSEKPDGWGIDSRDNGSKRDRDDEEEGTMGKRRRFNDN